MPPCGHRRAEGNDPAVALPARHAGSTPNESHETRRPSTAELRRVQIAAKNVGYGDRGGKTMKNFIRSLTFVALLVLAGVGSAAAQQPQAPPPSKFKLMSSAFDDGS